MISSTIVSGNSFPLLKAGTTPELFEVVCRPYVVFSKIQGFVPALDLCSLDQVGQTATMIINQISVGRALFDTWRNGRLNEGLRLKISRVAEGRTAPYTITILPRNPIPQDEVNYESSDESEEDS